MQLIPHACHSSRSKLIPHTSAPDENVKELNILTRCCHFICLNSAAAESAEAP